MHLLEYMYHNFADQLCLVIDLNKNPFCLYIYNIIIYINKIIIMVMY